MIINNWLASIIGNSRLHWGYFCGKILEKTWQTKHVNTVEDINNILATEIVTFNDTNMPIYVVSVVSSQTKLFSQLPQVVMINKKDIPLKNTYSTMGIDRILTLFSAGYKYKFPCLVIDGGTALTFTGANQKGELVGGAILPGVKLQLNSLASHTAALPLIEITDKIPSLWAMNTSEAIESGIIYTIIAGINFFINDWENQFPDSQIIVTGGDAFLFKDYLHFFYPNIKNKIIFDQDLMFWGVKFLLYNRDN